MTLTTGGAGAEQSLAISQVIGDVGDLSSVVSAIKRNLQL